MDNFKQTLYDARQGNKNAIIALYNQYLPMIKRLSWHDGVFDEDLYQALSIAFLTAVGTFRP